jgi:transposase
MPLYVGVDVGCDTAVVCVLPDEGTRSVLKCRVPNTMAGAADLAQRVAQAAQSRGADRVHIGIESTGNYSWHLARAMAGAAALAPYQPQVYVLNPAYLVHFRASGGPRPKTDRTDAHLIADYVRVGRNLPRPYAPDLRYLPLRTLTRLHSHLAHSLVVQKTYALSHLFLTFSGFSQTMPFSDPFGAASSALLNEFTTEHIAQMPVDDLAGYLQTRGRSQFADPVGLAQTLQRAAADSFPLDAALVGPLRHLLASTFQIIETIQQELAQTDAQIRALLRDLPQTLTTIPGVGDILAAGILAEIGDITRFPDEEHLASYAGLTWTAYESGRFAGEEHHLTQAGNAYLRYYLVEAANSVRVRCPEFQAYYQRKCAEATVHKHKRAVVMTARKFVRTVDALLRTGETYHAPTAPASAGPSAAAAPAATAAVRDIAGPTAPPALQAAPAEQAAGPTPPPDGPPAPTGAAPALAHDVRTPPRPTRRAGDPVRRFPAKAPAACPPAGRWSGPATTPRPAPA